MLEKPLDRRRLRWRAPWPPSLMRSVCSFVLLVNLSTPLHLACDKVPVLKELAASVALLSQPQGRCGKRLCAVYRSERHGHSITVHLGT